MFVRPHGITRLSTGPIFMKIQVSLNSDRNNTSHEDLCTFVIISRSVLLHVRNVSDNSSIDNAFYAQKLPFENHTVYDYKNVQPNRPMHIAYWITKATNTHSEYIQLIAFSLQQLLHERASILLYTYNAGLFWGCGIL